MYSSEKIIEWIAAIGGEAAVRVDESTEWVIQGIVKGMTIAIVRVKSEDRIIIQRGITFSENHMTNQKRSDPSIRSQFIHELKRDLLLASARFRIESDPADQSIITLMITEAYIYDDGASKHNFFNAYFDVVDASLLCILAVEKYFGDESS